MPILLAFHKCWLAAHSQTKIPKLKRSAWGFTFSPSYSRGLVRCSDLWFALLPAPSHAVSSISAYGTVAFCGFRPHLQRRVRVGIAPTSLPNPCRLSIDCRHVLVWQSLTALVNQRLRCHLGCAGFCNQLMLIRVWRRERDSNPRYH